MRRLRERVEGLLESLAGGIENLLRLSVICVTVHIELVSARAKKRRGEHLGGRG
jgi:hypothetical protein